MTASIFRALGASGSTVISAGGGAGPGMENQASMVFNRKQKSVRLNWGAVPGQAYRVQYKDGFSSGDWIDVAPDIVAEGTAASVSLPKESEERLYRILVIR
ncbi:MAG: N-acetylmuramoyl-L-alanine amidase family 2 [Pedosphaera sp.]|nr:N-acetylmuramoyl-L-alanine amidase family 2 [Pedosphaera sp.]